MIWIHMMTKTKIETGATLEQRKRILWGTEIALNWGSVEHRSGATKHHYKDGFFKITYEEYKTIDDKRALTVYFKMGGHSGWEKVLKAEIRKERYSPPSKVLLYAPGIWESLLHLTYNNVKREKYISKRKQHEQQKSD
jgi:hypothetical protein